MAALFVGVDRARLLPPKFSLDSAFIQRLALSGHLSGVDRSFSNTAAVYRLLGLQGLPAVVAVITVLAEFVLVLTALRRHSGSRAGVLALALSVVSLLLGGVYLATYSKDAPVLLVAFALVRGGRSWRGEAAFLAAAASYAYIFRSYWFLVLFLYVAMRLAYRVHQRWWTWLVVAVGAMIGFSLVVAYGLHHDPDYFRTAVNLGRTGNPDAQTMIRPAFGGPEPLAGAANVMAAFGSLFVPVPLLLMGSPYYIGIFVLIASIWSVFWFAVIRSNGQGNDCPEWRRAVAFLVAFVTVQAFFEPDFGSSLRHLTPLLPVILVVASHAPRTARAGGRLLDHPERGRLPDEPLPGPGG